MSSAPLNILLIGFGNMGQALYNGWKSQNHTVVIVDPVVEEGEGCFNRVTDAVIDFLPDLIVLAIKPQILDIVLSDYTHLKNTKAVVLSIMAGVSLNHLDNFFGAHTPIVRSMPNTPVMVGRGMTVCTGNSNITSDHKKMTTDLLNVVGQTAWVDDEYMMHAVTAVSGSGPAYIFHMIEAMAAAGVEVGLSEGLAQQLARETVIGAADLANQSEEGADILRKRVTSKGGTTQAALDVLMKEEGGLKELINQTVSAAAKRSQVLG